MVLDDAPLAEAIQRQWQARSDDPIEVRNVAMPDWSGQVRLTTDVFVYPPGFLGELTSRRLVRPLSSEAIRSAAFAAADIFPLTWFAEVRWGDAYYAVPLGSPQLTIMYRSDIFERLGVEPPRSWQEYGVLVERLASEEDIRPEGEGWHPVAEPLGPGWAGQLLLARVAAYARHPSQYSALFNFRTMEPLITEPPYVRALEELLQAAGHGSPEAIGFSPAETRRELLAGRCAMALSWPTAADAGQTDVTAAGPIGFAPLPGSAEVFRSAEQRWEQRGGEDSPYVPLLAISGRLGSVAADARDTAAATAVLQWLSGAEGSRVVCPKSAAATLFRESHLEHSTEWYPAGGPPEEARQYAETVRETQREATYLMSPRIPGRTRYLAALDTAVHDAVAGRKNASDALAEAAGEWREITQFYGVDKQRQAYESSLGLGR